MAKDSVKFEAESFPMSKLITWGMVACQIAAIICIVGMISMHFHPALTKPYYWYITVLLFLGNLAVAFHCYGIKDDRIEINDEGVHRVRSNGTRLSLAWKDISRTVDKKLMQEFVVSDEKGANRIVIDYQFKNFDQIRERILIQLK